jgi:hypothetical protein
MKHRYLIHWEIPTHDELVTYQLTGLDYQTIARALSFDGTPKPLMLWTYLRRFAYCYPKPYTQLHRVVELIAKAINPQWFPGGMRHHSHMTNLLLENRFCSRDSELMRARVRVNNAHADMDTLDPAVFRVIDEVFSLRSDDSALGVIQYEPFSRRAAKQGTAKQMRDILGKEQHQIPVDVGDPAKDNWFYTTSRARVFHIRTEMVSL